MVKSRMNTADVAAEVSCLRQRLVGMRLANVYDESAKVFTLKMARSGEEGEKVMLIMESGSRFHTTETQTVRASNDLPGNFTMKLRKHLRTRRLSDIRQLGMDRIVDFVFGAGETEHHLILELYSQGNVVLADSSYTVLSLLRSHRDDDKMFAIMPGHPYPVHACRLRTSVTAEELEAQLQAASEDTTLRTLTSQWLPYGPALVEHILVSAGLQAVANKPGFASTSNFGAEEREKLLGSIKAMESWFDACEASPPPGFICIKPAKPASSGSSAAQATLPPPAGADAERELYQEYCPLVLAQHTHMRSKEFPTFDAALSEFYAKIEVQKAQQAQAQQENAVLQKLDRVKADQTKRAEQLAKEAEAQERRALLIHLNLDAVDAAINAVNSALASGLDWAELEQMVKAERKAGNPVAGIISSMALDSNKITLVLKEPEDEEESSSEDGSSSGSDSEEGQEERGKLKQKRGSANKGALVEVDLSRGAHANASMHHTVRKKHQEKHRRTVEANQTTFKTAEKKAMVQMQQVKSVASIRTTRKVLWFEKFHWFVSSENYLVLTGRDAQQNELLVKRYLSKGDIYVHADLHGASTTVVKNPRPEDPVPPTTLNQAGTAAVCRSKAWDAKIVTSAWWVHPHQVSKTAPTGEYLPTGSFMIRGKKNFLPPSQLVMGFGLLFKLEESSVGAHLGERSVRGPRDTEDSFTVTGTTMDSENVSATDGFLGDLESMCDTDTTLESDAPMSSALPPAAARDEPTEDEGSEAAESGNGSPARAPPTTSSAAPATPGLGMQSGYEADECDDSSDVGRSELEAFLDGTGLGMGSLLGSGGVRTDRSQQERAACSTSTTASGELLPTGPRHLSAKQRRQMQREGVKAPHLLQGSTAGPAEAEGATGVTEDEEAKAIAAARAAEAQRKAAKKEAMAPPPQNQRGKKGKAKKMKEKYGDQDEEDRELAMQLLASAGQKVHRRQARKEKKAARQFTSHVPQPELPDGLTPAQLAQKISGRDRPEHTQPAVKPGVSGEGVIVTSGDPPAGKQRGGNTSESKEIAELLAEENIVDLSEADREKLTELDSLTGIPRGEDLLLFCVPVCAPYAALNGFKFRVKLTPGREKKGKAAKTAMGMFGQTSDIWPREKDLLRAVTDAEIVGGMVGPVHVSMPGLAAAKSAQRRAKKGK